MQLSIELLPAPFGPMMARISCSRTSKEMSVSALTPPKRSEMFCTSRMTSPILRASGLLVAALRDGQAAFTSTIFSMRQVGATVPVRPSSNFTWVSTYCSRLPP